MADIHTKAQRSYNMSRIRASKTKPELKIKKLMKKLGFDYQPKGIFGKPDFASKKKKVVVFVDGCFWHKCPKCYIKPKSRVYFWVSKIKKNVERDRDVNKRLKKEGWKVIRLWEHDLKGF